MADFAIGTYEINLLNNEDLKNTFNTLKNVCEYVDTAINYDNDYLLPAVIDKDTKIISKISSCHYTDYEFFVSNHLKCLKRESIEMMLIHSGRGDWSHLAKKLVKDSRFNHIGVSNFTVEQMVEFHQLTGLHPYANELEINPYYTDLAAIEYCKANGIKVIAYAVLGGKYNSWQSVARFGLNNLLAFASKYADIVIVRANSLTEAEHFYYAITCDEFSFAMPIEPNTIAKTIEPMQYKLPSVKCNLMFGQPTYMRECHGQHIDDSCSIKGELLLLDQSPLPKFEMLGDYKTYLRYKYNANRYISFGDWLDIGNDEYIAVYLWDKTGVLTKVTNNLQKLEVWKWKVSIKTNEADVEEDEDDEKDFNI